MFNVYLLANQTTAKNGSAYKKPCFLCDKEQAILHNSCLEQGQATFYEGTEMALPGLADLGRK